MASHPLKVAGFFAGFAGASIAFIILAAVLLHVHESRLQSLPDPSALVEGFERRVSVPDDPLPPLVLPAGRAEGVSKIYNQLTASPLTEALHTDAVNEAALKLHPDTFAKIDISVTDAKVPFYDNVASALKIICSDQMKKAYDVHASPLDCRESAIGKLGRYIPVLLKGCSVGTSREQVAQTLVFGLKAQQMLGRLASVATKANEQAVTGLMQPLVNAIESCASRWDALAAGCDEQYLHIPSQWLRAPLSQDVFTMAWDPAETFYHPDNGALIRELRPYHFHKDPIGKLGLLPFDTIKAQMSFLQSDKLPGPVWYKEHIEHFVAIVGTDEHEKAYWRQHLLQTLPFEMVGPWCEDFVYSAASQFTTTETLAWLHWSSTVQSGRLYDMILHSSRNNPQDQPARPYNNDSATGGAFVRQLIGFPTNRPGILIKPLDTSPSSTPNSKSIATPKAFALEALSSSTFENIFKETSAFANEASPLQFATLKENQPRMQFMSFAYILNVLSGQIFDEFGFFSRTDHGFELDGSVNPEFLKVVGAVIFKSLQYGVTPLRNLSNKLVSFLISLAPPSQSSCLLLAKDIVQPDTPGTYEPSFDSFTASLPTKYHQSAVLTRCLQRRFGLGTRSDDANVQLQRRLTSAEWYMKRCRQLFLDTLHAFSTRAGWTFIDADWFSHISNPQEDVITMEKILKAVKFDPDCMVAKVGGKKLENVFRQIMEEREPKDILEWLSRGSHKSPLGLVPSRFRFHCKLTDKDAPFVGDMFGSNVVSNLYTSVESFAGAIDKAMAEWKFDPWYQVDETPESKYEDCSLQTISA